MHKTIISDTGCFIILSKIGELELLHKLYGQIITTSEIAEEFGETLPKWVVIQKATDKYRQRILEMQIDKGESSAIVKAKLNGTILSVKPHLNKIKETNFRITAEIEALKEAGEH